MQLARTPLAAFGVVLTTACALLFLLALGVESYGFIENPYVGILIYGALPIGFAFGLALVFIGNMLGRRRGQTEVHWPVLDLSRRGQRVFVMSLVAASVVNIVIFAMAGVGAVHYMETPAFCGQVCHQVMTPEFVGHAQGPHANVTCVSCHVGSGAGALVQSKLDGMRRLRAFLTNTYRTPIPTPVADLRPARDTCATCHWPEKIHGTKLRVVKEYADDEAVSETVTTLEVKVGGGSHLTGIGEGIHWHMNVQNRIEFVSLDAARQDIPYVKMTSADGTVREWRKEGVTDAQIAAGTHRLMDCTDCHNRPSHTFSATAERAVDKAIADGQIPRSLPFVRREVVKALKTEAASSDEALATIDKSLRTYYSSAAVATRPAPAELERTITVAKALYGGNVFPQMKITWGTYRNNIGHMDSPGCFRCHDEEKKTAEGKTISQDCDSCHTMR
jgi:hypothetical protein